MDKINCYMNHYLLMTWGTHLKERFRVTNNIEKTRPSGHFSFASTTDDNIQRCIKMIQELDCVGEQNLLAVIIIVHIRASAGLDHSVE